MTKDNEQQSKLKFDAVVGNPPYNERRLQMYPDFYLAARELAENVSMILQQQRNIVNI